MEEKKFNKRNKKAAVAKSWEVIQMYQQLQRGAPSSKSSKSGVCVCVCVCMCVCVCVCVCIASQTTNGSTKATSRYTYT